MRRKIILTSFFLIFSTYHTLAYCYDSDALMNTAGPYLISADLNSKFLRTKCAYASSLKSPSTEARYNEIKSTLNLSDRKEVEEFYRSSEYKIRTDRNQQILDDLFTKFSNGTDEKTACGMLWGVLAPSFIKAEDDWKRAKKSIRK